MSNYSSFDFDESTEAESNYTVDINEINATANAVDSLGIPELNDAIHAANEERKAGAPRLPRHQRRDYSNFTVEQFSQLTDVMEKFEAFKQMFMAINKKFVEKLAAQIGDARAPEDYKHQLQETTS